MFPDFSRELIVSHTWAAPGDYEISAVLDLSNGLQVNGMTTASVGEPSAAAIILSTVQFLHTNVSGWPVTSEITRVEIREQLICMFHTKANVWPGIDIPASGGSGPLYGNPWVFVNIGGTFYAGTFEWMRPGQQCKDLSPGEYGGNLADRMGPHIKVEPLGSWKPKKGEIIGLMYSTLARDGNRTLNERSNVVLVEWPF